MEANSACCPQSFTSSQDFSYLETMSGVRTSHEVRERTGHSTVTSVKYVIHKPLLFLSVSRGIKAASDLSSDPPLKRESKCHLHLVSQTLYRSMKTDC